MKTSSKIGSFLKGFAYTAFTGALMAGIFLGVTAAVATIAPSFAASFGIKAAESIGVALATSGIVGLSTGIFGGIIQIFSNDKHEKAMHAAAYSPSNGRDIAITAVSQNLMSPKLQAALERASAAPALPERETETAPTTHFQNQHATQRSSINEIVNRKLTGAQTSHTERLTADRLAQTVMPTRTIQ